ncbi:MAG: hypothetical protein LAO79_03190 [Acidobacteriia bacterium]|nr:hypothetical protein [Terriglobia bacterium]
MIRVHFAFTGCRALRPMAALAVLFASAAAAQSDSGIADKLREQILGQVRRPLPAGFTVSAQSGSTGRALTGSFAANASARRAFSAAWRMITPYFDSAPVLRAAAGDIKDQQVQAAFSGVYQGAPMRGFMFVSSSNGAGHAAILFDRADLFPRTVQILARQVAASLPRGGQSNSHPVAPMELTRTQLTDGSGWVSLAPGWKITGAYKGTVDTVGPNGEWMSLGGYSQVFARTAPNSGQMYGPLRPPWPALQLSYDVQFKGALSRGETRMRLIEQAPDMYPGGQAAWLHYEIQSGGKSYRGLAWVATANIPSDIPMWFYYSSFCGAPSEQYPQALPTMIAQWKSWGVSQAVFRERMDAALRSMRETYQIIQDIHNNQTRAYSNANAAWDETIRGVTMIEDVTNRGRAEVTSNNAQWIVDEMNRQGYNFRVVPLNELVP